MSMEDLSIFRQFIQSTIYQELIGEYSIHYMLLYTSYINVIKVVKSEFRFCMFLAFENFLMFVQQQEIKAENYYFSFDSIMAPECLFINYNCNSHKVIVQLKFLFSLSLSFLSLSFFSFFSFKYFLKNCLILDTKSFIPEMKYNYIELCTALKKV